MLAGDPNSTSRLRLDFLLSTRWLGDGAPVRVSRFSALSDKQTHAYEGGAW